MTAKDRVNFPEVTNSLARTFHFINVRIRNVTVRTISTHNNSLFYQSLDANVIVIKGKRDSSSQSMKPKRLNRDVIGAMLDCFISP